MDAMTEPTMACMQAESVSVAHESAHDLAAQFDQVHQAVHETQQAMMHVQTHLAVYQHCISWPSSSMFNHHFSKLPNISMRRHEDSNHIFETCNT